jgi:hypothetical protein
MIRRKLSRVIIALAVVLVSSCARRSTASSDIEPTPGIASASITTIRRPTFYPHPGLEANKQGRLNVAVRIADHPTVGRRGTEVRIRINESDRPRVAIADTMGVARFDTLPAGNYRIERRHMGSPSIGDVRAPVTAGCETDVEIYVGVVSIGIAPPPTMRTRVVITTCPSNSSS